MNLYLSKMKIHSTIKFRRSFCLPLLLCLLDFPLSRNKANLNNKRFFLIGNTCFWTNVLNYLFIEQIQTNENWESVQQYTELMTILFFNSEKILAINLLRTKLSSISNLGMVRSIFLAGTILDLDVTNDIEILPLDVMNLR